MTNEFSCDVQIVGVVGLGTMGSGIAQVFATAGFPVIGIEATRELAEKGRDRIRSQLDRRVAKGKMTEAERDEILARIRVSGEVPSVVSADLVVEAIPEDLEAKQRLFRDLDALCRDHTILASNTSSISITRLAAATHRPDRCIGMHFFNPVPVMKLVEVVRGAATSDKTVQRILDLAQVLGKTPVEVRDFPGFVSNRVLMPMLNEAMYAFMEGVASIEAIDTVMKLGMNHPMGPLALADFIGLDVCLAILEVLHRELGDPKYRPCPLLRQMVAAGWLGQKSGRGFYEYKETPPRPNGQLERRG